MRIRYARISSSVGGFGERFCKRYNLKLRDAREPMVMFGLYTWSDYSFFLKHPYPLVVVWCGSDSARLGSNKRLPGANQSRRVILNRRKARHIATSKSVAGYLSMPHELLPVTPAEDRDPVPRGDYLYCYYGNEFKKDFYGYPLAKKVEKKTGIKCIYATSKTYDQRGLMEVYRDSFLGLRFTPRDGVSVTVVEMGMMGRRSIFNGDSPSSIPFTTIDDIVRNVKKEYANRHIDDVKEVSDSVKDYLNIGEGWLTV